MPPIDAFERALQVQPAERAGDRALPPVLPLAANRIEPNAIAMSTCHSHHVACQLRPNTTATMASARSTNAAATASGNVRMRSR